MAKKDLKLKELLAMAFEKQDWEFLSTILANFSYDEEKILPLCRKHTLFSQKILVVDDEEDLLDLYKEELQEISSSVWVAHDGIEAIKICENQAIDLVISDLKMPNLNGEKLAKIMHEKLPETKLIVVSGEFGDSDFHGLEVSERITKPIDFDKLKQTIRKLLWNKLYGKNHSNTPIT